MTPATELSATTGIARDAMVASQLRTNAVSDPRVIAAMARVPRERYVPARYGALAYRDTALDIGEGRRINPPMTTGRLLTEAYLRATDRVLLIGAGGGYAAAVLADIVASVTAVESDAALVSHAREALAGLANVTLVERPLAAGHAEGAPYDVLVIDGAVERVPDALIEQLAPGGRIVTGLVDRGVTRLAMGSRTAGGYGLQDFADTDCVMLPGFAEPRSFSFSFAR